MAELRRLTVDELEARLATVGNDVLEPRRSEPGPDREGYREAASLLGSFEAGALRPTRGATDDVALRALVTEDSERVTTAAGSRWRLAPPVRLETIRRLGTRPRLLATLADASPDDTDHGRHMAEAYLRGTAPPLGRQSMAQLHGTLQAIEWLAPVDVAVPTVEEVRGKLRLASLLQPLRALVGDHFVGRAAELGRLTEYVEVLPPGSMGRAVARRLRRVFRLAERPPLVIHGPGGIGKSTLVAKFVLDHVELDAGRQFPFAYLSFDRAELRPDQPLTLLAEAVRQLGAEFPAVAEPARLLEEAIGVTQSSEVAARTERSPSKRSSRAVAEVVGRNEHDLLVRFGALVEEAIDGRELPNLWILDTFERAQRRGGPAVEQLWTFLDELQSVFPRLRVVFAGRAPLTSSAAKDGHGGHATEDLALHGFDDAAAETLLRRQLGGVEASAKFLRSVAAQVGANPLSLKLAAELIRRLGPDGLSKVQTRRRILFKLGAEEVQGLLYRRILDHLADPDLRRIANPGLVVRRVTPDVIAEVLARPCGLGTIDDDRARHLFELLKVEVSLVEPVDADTVVHRADVRRTMLPLLARDDPKRVARIHRAAVSYYADQRDPAARTEELYHRLALSQSSATLDKRWDANAGRLLDNALDELPPASQVYLAGKLGLSVEPAVLAQADETAWARQAVRLGQELLDTGHPSDALKIVRQRSGKGLPLDVRAVEIEALATLGRMDEALDLVGPALRDATDKVRPTEFVQLAVLGARIAEDTGQFDKALQWVDDTADVADNLGDHILHLACGAAALRLHRRAGTGDSPRARLVRNAVVAEVGELTQRDRSRNPTLVRDLAAELGDTAPDLLADAAKLVGIDVEGEAGGILDDLLSSSDVDDFTSFVRERVEPSSSSQESAAEGGPGLGFLRGRTAAEQGQYVADFVKLAAPSRRKWGGALARVYQAESDRASF